MSDIRERLVRFAGKVCISTDTEIEAAAAIDKLRDGMRATIQERDVLSGENWELRADNEKLRAALCGVTSELEQFVQIFKGYQGMTMSNAQAALRAAAAALKETDK